jgi:hypothetical protein
MLDIQQRPWNANHFENHTFLGACTLHSCRAPTKSGVGPKKKGLMGRSRRKKSPQLDHFQMNQSELDHFQMNQSGILLNI